MMRGGTADARSLHIVDRPYAGLQFRRQLAHPEHGERHLYAKILDEMDDGVVQSARLWRRRIDVARLVDQHDLLAVEHGECLHPVAALAFHAQSIRPTQRHLARVAELDLLPGLLYRVVARAHADAEALLSSEEVRHAHQNCAGLRFRLGHCSCGLLARCGLLRVR